MKNRNTILKIYSLICDSFVSHENEEDKIYI